jgi:hypothetical protein
MIDTRDISQSLTPIRQIAAGARGPREGTFH